MKRGMGDLGCGWRPRYEYKVAQTSSYPPLPLPSREGKCFAPSPLEGEGRACPRKILSWGEGYSDMKVGVYYRNSDVRVEERPVPMSGDHDIVIKVMACGLCGSDLLEWYRIKRAPLVLGHEPAGIVVETGKLVTNVKPGDRVFVTHHVPCNTCHQCRTGHKTACATFQTANNFDPGGFSQFLLVTGKSVE